MKIAEQFGKELQDLLDRYKNKMTTPDIMRAAQPIFTKTIGIRDNPERFKIPTELLNEPDPEFKKLMQGEFKWVED